MNTIRKQQVKEAQRRYKLKKKEIGRYRVEVFLPNELYEKSCKEQKSYRINRQEFFDKVLTNYFSNNINFLEEISQLKTEREVLRKKCYPDTEQSGGGIDSFDVSMDINQYAKMTRKELLVQVKKQVFWLERLREVNDVLMDHV